MDNCAQTAKRCIWRVQHLPSSSSTKQPTERCFCGGCAEDSVWLMKRCREYLLTLSRQPIVTGTSVLGIKYKDGIMLAADNLGVSKLGFVLQTELSESSFQRPMALSRVSRISSACIPSETTPCLQPVATCPTSSTYNPFLTTFSSRKKLQRATVMSLDQQKFMNISVRLCITVGRNSILYGTRWLSEASRTVKGLFKFSMTSCKRHFRFIYSSNLFFSGFWRTLTCWAWRIPRPPLRPVTDRISLNLYFERQLRRYLEEKMLSPRNRLEQSWSNVWRCCFIVTHAVWTKWALWMPTTLYYSRRHCLFNWIVPNCHDQCDRAVYLKVYLVGHRMGVCWRNSGIWCSDSVIHLIDCCFSTCNYFLFFRVFYHQTDKSLKILSPVKDCSTWF